MSQQLISRSSDLKKLRDNGYSIEIKGAFLLVRDIPYVNANTSIEYGTLVTPLTLSGERTTKPKDHIVNFIGDHPCTNKGEIIQQIKHQTVTKTLLPDLVTHHSFSNKPSAGYKDYYEKMSRYADVISAHAISIDDTVTPRSYNVISSEDKSSVFSYLDTNSSRAEIDLISNKLVSHNIGIIGLGGTGSYILDLVVKTPVKAIHLFDGDSFLQHNAFRAPGAPSVQDLQQVKSKTDYFKSIYSSMHNNIHSHAGYINDSNIEMLSEFDFLFICLDSGSIKNSLFTYLDQKKISFIDVGMGLEVVDDQLIGLVRVTASSDKKRDHISKRISFSDGEDAAYSTNIQVADLNMLNASLAVIKWKKMCGFYQDIGNENNLTYSLNVNTLTNDDHHEP